MTASFDYLFKVLLTGNSGVGKSSILDRYASGVFSEIYNGTIGLDFKVKTVEHAGKNIKLQLWDTGGQEKFRTITNSYYRGAQAILLVYDVTDQESFVTIKDWLCEVEAYADENVCKFIVGNKIDNSKGRVVDTEAAKAFATEQGAEFTEVSAKTGHNIDELFWTVTGQLLENYTDDDGDGMRRGLMSLPPPKKRRKSVYCSVI